MNDLTQIAVHGKGVVLAATTATATATTWLEQANAIVDLVAGGVAIAAGLCTIGWYIYRYFKLRGGAGNDKTDTS